MAGDRFSEFVATLQQQDLRHGAMLDVLAAGMNRTYRNTCCATRTSTPNSATLRQARAIITTARRQGLDSGSCPKLAAAMGHEAEESWA